MTTNIKVNSTFVNAHMGKISSMAQKIISINSDAYASTTNIPSKEPGTIQGMLSATQNLYGKIVAEAAAVIEMCKSFENIDFDLSNLASELNMTPASKKYPIVLSHDNLAHNIDVDELLQKGNDIFDKYGRKIEKPKVYTPPTQRSSQWTFEPKSYSEKNNSKNDNKTITTTIEETNNESIDNKTVNPINVENISSKNDVIINKIDEKNTNDNNSNIIDENKEIFNNDNTSKTTIENNVNIPENKVNQEKATVNPNSIRTQKNAKIVLKTVGMVTAASAVIGGAGYGIYNNIKSNNTIDEETTDNNQEEE